ATVRVRFRDPHGRAGAVPLVLQVAAPGAAQSAIRARLETKPVAGTGHGELVLENPGAAPVAGRVVFVLPGGVTTEPESMPAQIGAGSRTSVPLVVQATGDVPAARYPAFAIFEYSDGGTQYTVVESTTMEVVAGKTAGRGLRLLVGLAAL